MKTDGTTFTVVKNMQGLNSRNGTWLRGGWCTVSFEVRSVDENIGVNMAFFPYPFVVTI